MLTLEKLKAISDLVKIYPLAKRANLNDSTVRSKLVRANQELSDDERKQLTTVLRDLRNRINEAIR
jgi:hypothetical protein